MMSIKRVVLSFAVLTACVVPSLAGCSSGSDEASTGQSSAELGNGYDHPFWTDPHFPGSTKYTLNGAAWYDSDISTWTTGSIVRLPTDAKYIGNIYSTVHCTNGTTAQMRSPEFEATVAGVTRNFIFNHLETIFINEPVGTWFNGGAVIGLTGGGTCVTGYPTLSSGPHFCNEMEGEDPYTFWHPLGPSYVSTCKYANGTSGAANPVCPACAGAVCGAVCCPSGDFCGPQGQCCDGLCGGGCPC